MVEGPLATPDSLTVKRIMPSVPDWKLPPGVTRGLWDYLHDPLIARTYDASLAGSAVCGADLAFAERHFTPPGQVIDLGCGTGRLLVHLAVRGFGVLGVDLSEEMLKVTGERAAAAGVAVHLIKANLVDLDCLADQSFDFAACLFSTLGMVAGAAERRQVVGHVFRLLRPNGTFVLHVHNRWFNLRDPHGRAWFVRNALRALLGKEEGGDRVMPVHQGIAGLRLHIFTRREVGRLLTTAGFRLIEIQPVGLAPDGRLPYPGWLPWLRAQGYLIAARKP